MYEHSMASLLVIHDDDGEVLLCTVQIQVPNLMMQMTISTPCLMRGGGTMAPSGKTEFRGRVDFA